MAAPVDSARVATNVATAATTWAINVGSPVAGTLLIVYVRTGAGGAFPATFTGYTEITSAGLDASDDEIAIYYRWADGTEGATDTIDFFGASSLKGCAICWEVTGAENPAVSAPTIGAINTGTTAANTANPSSVAPAGAPRDTLYIAMAGGDGEVGAYTATPTNYVNLQAANSGTGGAAATNCFIGGASREILASSSDDPGVFTHAAHSNGWSATTVAIRSAVVAAPGPVLPDPSRAYQHLLVR